MLKSTQESVRKEIISVCLTTFYPKTFWRCSNWKLIKLLDLCLEPATLNFIERITLNNYIASSRVAKRCARAALWLTSWTVYLGYVRRPPRRPERTRRRLAGLRGRDDALADITRLQYRRLRNRTGIIWRLRLCTRRSGMNWGYVVF